ncbi:MAG: carbohydrate ABC transporter permease [Clostridia bacterium]|nr:carbohydrate ABC transporter permease [Clostridia bacterium]NLS85100.1 carbohydrate ABC transporter permease [Oscillospiraceae bacterium]
MSGNTAVRIKKVDVALTIRRIIAYTVLILLTFISLFSFYILFVNATRSNADIQTGFSFLPGKAGIANFKNVMADTNIPVLRGLLNSAFVATACAVLSTYFSTLTAYALHAYRFKGHDAAYRFILLIMMVPTQVSALGFVRLMDAMGLTNTFLPLIVPTIAAPVTFFFMIQYMKSSLPIEIVEAARIDGSGEFATFNRMVIPMMKPAIAVQAIFTFVTNWNNYFIPALILQDSDKKTLPILIAMLRSADWLKFDMGKVYMLITLAILPVIVVYLCLSKHIVGGVALGGVKG